MILDVTHVLAKPNFSLFLEFQNGERRRVDMAAYMDEPVGCADEGTASLATDAVRKLTASYGVPAL